MRKTLIALTALAAASGATAAYAQTHTGCLGQAATETTASADTGIRLLQQPRTTTEQDRG